MILYFAIVISKLAIFHERGKVTELCPGKIQSHATFSLIFKCPTYSLGNDFTAYEFTYHLGCDFFC